MRKRILYIAILLITVNSCIVIEDDPLVVVTPTVNFQGHIRSGNVYVTATINANPAFINPGNIATVFLYTGELSLYSTVTGELLNSTEIAGDGLTNIVEVSASAESFDKIVIIASGSIAAYADKESDGDASNDLFLHQADFYQELLVADIISLSDYPIITLAPEVDFQTYIRGGELYATSTISANPAYINQGNSPAVFTYNGILQIYDETSGALLKSRAITGNGLSNSATVFSDTASFSGFIVISSGEVTCTGDVDADGDPSNDIFISNSKFYDIILVDLIE